MVKQIVDVKTIVVNNETESLILDAGALAQITASGSITNLTDISIRDSGGATFGGAVTASNDFIISESAGDIIFNGALTAGTFTQTADANTAYNLEFNAGGTITDAVNFSNAGTVTIGDGTGTDVMTFTGGLIVTTPTALTLAQTIATTNTDMTLGDSGTGITLAADTILNAGSGALNINGAVTGGNNSLALNTTGTTTIGAAISGITTLTTNAIGTTAVSANISSSGQQTFNDAVTVDGTLDFTASQVEFNSTLQGADGTGDNLTISGILDLNAAATNLTSLVVEGATELGGNVTTSGLQIPSNLGTKIKSTFYPKQILHGQK